MKHEWSPGRYTTHCTRFGQTTSGCVLDSGAGDALDVLDCRAVRLSVIQGLYPCAERQEGYVRQVITALD